MKRTPLKRRSKKRSAEERLYSKLAQEYLEKHPVFAVTGRPATQIHHKAGRHGRWLNDTQYWLAVSMKGHDIIHRNPAYAMEQGWILKRS